MKKILSLLIVITMIASLFAYPVLADDGIKVTINGVEQKYDVMPVIINGRTLVPMRGIYEALGAEITWIDATKTVVGARDNKHIKLRINSDAVYVDGVEQEKKLDVPAQIINSRTMVPVRFIAESFGETVNWNADTKTVEITSDYLKEVAVSDKLATLPSRFHRPIPREFTKSSELGDWIYLENEKDDVVFNDPSKFSSATEIMTYDEFLNAGGFDENGKTETSYGYKEVIDINEEGIDAKKAMRVVTKEVPSKTNLHVLLYGTLLKGRFKAGDNVLLTFKARLTEGGYSAGRLDAPTGTIWASLQEPVKFTKSIWQDFAITDKWQTMYLPAIMKDGFDDFAIRFGYCQAPQTIEIADFKLLNFGQTLPEGLILNQYTGKGMQELDPDAEWRKEAEKRIEQIRKGDFKIKVTDNNGNPVPNATVTFDMYESAFPFGSVYQVGYKNSDQYNESFSKYFNGTVMESNMKWGTFELDNNDNARNGMTKAKSLGALYLRDHAIAYDRHMHTSTQRLIPDDVMKAIKAGDIEYVDKRTKEWVYRISDLFAGEFYEIDVTNEIAVCPSDDKVYKDKEGNDVTAIGGGFYKTLGPEYYDKIYKWTREANPNSILCVTEADTLIDASKRKTVVNPILENLKKNENTYDVVGYQGHYESKYFAPSEHDALYNDMFNNFGAPTSMTEFTIELGDDVLNANFARDIFISSIANENFTGIWLWGHRDYSENSTVKAIMDNNYNIKPCGEVIIDIIYNKMYTHYVTVTTDANGEATIRGFYGNYDVSIDANGKNKKLMAAFHKGYENLLEVNIDDTMYASIKGEKTVKEDTVENTNTEVFVPVTTPQIKEEVKSEEKKEEISEAVNDTNLPQNGKVILTQDMINARIGKANYIKKTDDGGIRITITEIPSNQMTKCLQFTANDIKGKIAPGDVCIFSYKARLLSGGENGIGYMIPYVQTGESGKYKKPVFKSSDFKSEWTTCYIPFGGIEGLEEGGMRFGGMVQEIEIKDFQLINYGNSLKIEDLPSTLK